MTQQDRLAAALADKAELERDRLLAELLDAELVRQETKRQHGVVVGALEALPSELMRRLESFDLDDRTRKIIRDGVVLTVDECRLLADDLLIVGDEDDRPLR